jgi:hypothetical protein
MLADEKKTQLTHFLGQVPEDVAARLAKAIEVDRLIGNTGLPHDEILDALRPKLIKAAAVTRTPTPQRFFCQPFEDLLVASQPGKKQRGRISRDAVQPVWNWLAAEAFPEKHAALTTGIRFAILSGRYDEVMGKSTELWTRSASVLKDATSSDSAKRQMAKKLGTAALADEAAEMGLLLGAGPAMAKLQDILPKPLPSLTDTYMLALRDIYDRVFAADTAAAAYIPLIAMRRLAKPYEALRLSHVVSRRSAETMIDPADLGPAGDILFDDLEHLARRIGGVRAADFDINMLLEDLAGFVELSSGIVKEMGIQREGAWTGRLSGSRAAVASAMESLLARAPEEILAALPEHKGGKLELADLVQAPNGERVVRAMRYACLIAHAKPFAVAGAFGEKLQDALAAVAGELKPLSEALLESVRFAQEKKIFADQYFEIAADLCAQIIGADDADTLRARARAA